MTLSKIKHGISVIMQAKARQAQAINHASEKSGVESWSLVSPAESSLSYDRLGDAACAAKTRAYRPIRVTANVNPRKDARLENTGKWRGKQKIK